MKQYLDLLSELISLQGENRSDRTGTGTLSKFGHVMTFDLEAGFPMITTKRISFKAISHELLWFIKGDTNIKYLVDNDIHIWDQWADENGDLGPVYGAQWRNFNGVDQIAQLMMNLRNDPFSRRHVVSAWNASDLPHDYIAPRDNVKYDRMALAPCHCLFQFYVSRDYKLSCQMYQRSADVFLGVPYNIASYALLTHIVAKCLGFGVGKLHWVGGDVHLYLNHIDQAKEQIARECYKLPYIEFHKWPKSIFEYQPDSFSLANYRAHESIKAVISV